MSKVQFRIICFFVYLLVCFSELHAQDCGSAFNFTPVQKNNSIEWGKFPEFSLPFKIVYEGPRFDDQQSSPLKRGFSHLAKFSGNEFNTLPAANRAITWYHIVTDPQPSQPWADKEIKSPWGNNLGLYRQTWDNQLSNFSNLFGNSFGKSSPDFNLISLDVESIFDTDREIVATKSNIKTAQNYKNLADNQYLERYKRDIQKLYTAPIVQLKSKNISSNTKIGSYSDVMVRGSFNNWLALKAFNWSDWTTDPSATLHVMRDTLSGKVGGSFYNNLDFLTPSCYYFYNYNDPLGKDYLAYILFVVEANRYWSDKDIIPFVWLRYHNAFNPTKPFVPKFVAEATAIMPFFSGAKGLWLWDDPVENNSFNYATYEYFIGGLYRLSQFKRFFEGNYELIIPQPAIENAKSQTAIWRGVVKDGEILIAAQNPYSTSDNQNTTVTVKYKNWQKDIVLVGREVFLCSFKDILISATNPTLPTRKTIISPNPASDNINISFDSPNTNNGIVEIIDLLGRTVKIENINKNLSTINISTQNVPNGMYVLKTSFGNETTTQKILILK